MGFDRVICVLVRVPSVPSSEAEESPRSRQAAAPGAFKRDEERSVGSLQVRAGATLTRFTYNRMSRYMTQ